MNWVICFWCKIIAFLVLKSQLVLKLLAFYEVAGSNNIFYELNAFVKVDQLNI